MMMVQKQRAEATEVMAPYFFLPRRNKRVSPTGESNGSYAAQKGLKQTTHSTCTSNSVPTPRSSSCFESSAKPNLSCSFGRRKKLFEAAPRTAAFDFSAGEVSYLVGSGISEVASTPLELQTWS
jgi:hypothetical protein